MSLVIKKKKTKFYKINIRIKKKKNNTVTRFNYIKYILIKKNIFKIHN